MTLPYERYRSIIYARDLLRDLLDPKKTPRVPKYVRKKAYAALRHFPSEFEMELITKQAKDLLSTEDWYA